MMRVIYYTLGTGFGLGYSPIAPGTAGSILATLVAFFVIKGNAPYLIIATIVVFTVGVIASSYIEKEQEIKDPSLVVIDEIVGMWISVLIIPHVWWSFLIAFALFRFFDVVKPFPANNLQKLRGGLGIMIDDVIAGVYALASTHLILLLINY
jgi:phosphatidylglycerophosphatase A